MGIFIHALGVLDGEMLAKNMLVAHLSLFVFYLSCSLGGTVAIFCTQLHGTEQVQADQGCMCFLHFDSLVF